MADHCTQSLARLLPTDADELAESRYASLTVKDRISLLIPALPKGSSPQGRNSSPYGRGTSSPARARS